MQAHPDGRGSAHLLGEEDFRVDGVGSVAQRGVAPATAAMPTSGATAARSAGHYTQTWFKAA